MGLPLGRNPSGARRLDDAAGRIGGRFYSHFSGVQQDRVVRGAHRRVGAGAVTLVAKLDVGQDVLEADGLAVVAQLPPATLRPLRFV